MKGFGQKIILPICLLTLVSCIDPYPVEIDATEQLLTIDGMITDGPGPHRISLTRSDTYGSVFEGLIRPVSNATVIIRDELGNVEFLNEDLDRRGTYLTDSGFSGVVGRSYTLQIQLSDGKVYTSFSEELKEPVAIDKVYARSEIIPVEGEFEVESGVALYVDLTDSPEDNNFYFWRNAPSIYEYHARPDQYYPPKSLTPAPKDCCYLCYREENVGNNSIFLANDDTFNGLSTRIKAGFILDNGTRFVSTFRWDLKQLSISQEAYRYLRLVRQQIEISGSVFDPPPANIRGNMICLDDPDEVVLGYFMTAGESTRRIYINKSDLAYTQPDRILNDDCRVVDGNQENPPPDWNP